MDFSSWTRHLMRMEKTPICVEKEDMLTHLRPRKERRKHPRFRLDAPFEYSTSAGSPVRGGYAGDISETGLLVYSIDNLQVGAALKILIFYPHGYRLDKCEVVAEIVWKDYHYEKDWKGFKYGLQFVRISEEDRKKLREIIDWAIARQNNLWDPGDDRYPQSMEASP